MSLRLWLSGMMSVATKEIEKEKWPALVERMETALGTDMIPEIVDLEALWFAPTNHPPRRLTATLTLLPNSRCLPALPCHSYLLRIR